MRKIILVIVSFSLAFLTGCGDDNSSTVPGGKPSLVELVGRGESNLFSVAFDRYRTGIKDLPIGVFDSGIGGFTVLTEIIHLDLYNNQTHKPGTDGRHDFENERFIYLGDQANMPYGDYPLENKTEFLRELILKDAIFLLGQRYWLSSNAAEPRYDKLPVKAIVIACNTATAYGLEDVRAALEKWKLPVYSIGVIEAGARGAVKALRKQHVHGTIAVLATVGTCQSEGYIRAVEKFSEGLGITPPQVIQQGCLGFAGAIEGVASYITVSGDTINPVYRGPAVENQAAPVDTTILSHYGFEMLEILGERDNPATWQLNSVENYIRYHTTTLVEKYRQSGASVPISVVILGCTHFPYRVKGITKSFDRLRTFRKTDSTEPYRNLIAEHISFIDPAQLTAAILYQALAESSLLLEEGDKPVISLDEFYISVPNVSFSGTELQESGEFTYSYKYGRNPGRFDVEYVRRVPMSAENLTPQVRKNIQEITPVIWERIALFNMKSPRCTDLPASAKLTSETVIK